jgi:hypothetical protein
VKLNRGVLKAAEFKGLEWLNSQPIALKDLKGHAVLVHFWDYTHSFKIVLISGIIHIRLKMC